jgi:hypothetical protein
MAKRKLKDGYARVEVAWQFAHLFATTEAELLLRLAGPRYGLETFSKPRLQSSSSLPLAVAR